jgi:hypothetical protein
VLLDGSLPMQKVFTLTAFLTFSFAISANNGPNNLTPIDYLCFSIEDIQLPDGKNNQVALPKSASQDIFLAVENKLTAYRIPHKPCVNFDKEHLYIQLDTLNNGSNTLLYNYSIDIFVSSPFKYTGTISIYNIASFGRSSASPDIFLKFMKDSILGDLEGFAADFARAHP